MSGFERPEQGCLDVGVTQPHQAIARLDRNSSRRARRPRFRVAVPRRHQRQELADSPCRDPRLVHAFWIAVADRGQGATRAVRTCPRSRANGSREPAEHGIECRASREPDASGRDTAGLFRTSS